MPDRGILTAVTRIQQSLQQREGAGLVLCADCVGELVERALLRRQHHRLDIAQRDPLPLGGVQHQLFELARQQHHVRTQRVGHLARRVGIQHRAFALRLLGQPADGVRLVDSRQLDHAAPLAQSFAQPLVLVLVLHVHAPRIGRNANVVGDEKQQRLGIRRLEIVRNGRELLFFRAARIKRFDVTNENHLHRRHQARRPRAVQRLKDGGLRQIEIGDGKLSQPRIHRADQRIESSFAAALVEKNFVPGQHIAGFARGRRHLRDKAVHRREAAHARH